MPIQESGYSCIAYLDFNSINEFTTEQQYCVEQRPIKVYDDMGEFESSKLLSPVELRKFKNDLEIEARGVLDLEYGWDGDSARAISTQLVENVSDLLVKYASRIFNLYNQILERPSLSPLSNGSLDVEWENETASIIINFTNNQTNIAYYYARIFKGDQLEFDSNGQISTVEVNDMFANWLKNFSSLEKGSY